MATVAPRRKRSRCRCVLGLALLFDALGLAGLLVGGLLETEVSDLLIYLGGVGVFFSLPWWVFWHVGNLEVPPEELRDDVGLGWRSADAWSLESWRARRLALLARAFSAHFSLPASSSTAASASASVPSQVGRPRAHFAASATSSTSGSRPGELERLRRPSLTQEDPRSSSALFQASQTSPPPPPPPAPLPAAAAASLASAATTAPQDSTESLETQDHATQTSVLKMIGFHRKT